MSAMRPIPTSWRRVTKTDPEARSLADRHYTRLRPGFRIFTRPGYNLVLLSPDADAVFVWWRPKWENGRPGTQRFVAYSSAPSSVNESDVLSSVLIRDAVVALSSAYAMHDLHLHEVDPIRTLTTGVRSEPTSRRRSRHATPGQVLRPRGMATNGPPDSESGRLARAELVQSSRELETTMNQKWAKRFMSMAREIATWSKDPSTKMGAVAVDSRHRILATGYNGFPRGTNDDPKLYADRPTKYKRIVHAEANCVLNRVVPLDGATMFSLHMPCSDCTKLIIQAGVTTVIFEDENEKWLEDYEHSRAMMTEAGVMLRPMGLILGPMIYDCGCSMRKVEFGRCSVYDRLGRTR